MKKSGRIGVANIPKDVKNRFEYTEHEYLVAAGGGSTSAGKAKENYWTASTPILGYIDLTTGKESDVRANMSWVPTEAEHTTREFFEIFESCKIYMVKGLPPKLLGDSIADNVQRMSGLYLTEIMSDNEQNEFLQGLIEEFERVITISSELFGEMVLNKELDWYEGKGDWLGEEVDVTLSASDENEDVSDDLKKLEQFFKDQSEWDKKIRKFAAEEMTESANDWLADSVDEDEEEPPEITEEDFARRITIESIVFDEDGEFTVYFGDDDMFWGHSVVVYGDMEEGPNDAHIEG